MFNANRPDPSELPSSKQLLKSTGIAAVIASALLVFTVLPAEYGVDPTGVGSILGLTEMGRIKMQLAEEAAADAALDAANRGTTPNGVAAEPAPAVEPTPPATASLPADEPVPAGAAQDEIVINLAPDAGYEIKLVMEEGAKVQFVWFTNGPKVNYDTHADAPGIRYHGYEKGTGVDRQEGELTAAFTGAHGWFWRNRSGQPVTLTLQTTGAYSEVKRYN